jgi:hypothetical protein
MTPKEKAQELFKKFIEFTKEWDELDGYVDDEYRAKQCAFISVDEMIEQQQIQFENMLWSCVEYWKEVKNEIEKL